MSWYNQHVKWPFDPRKSRMDPLAFLDTIEDFHWLDYAGLIGRWRRRWGGCVAIGILEPGQVEDATTRCLGQIGIDPRGLDLRDERTNDSLPVHLLEIARHLGLHDLRAVSACGCLTRSGRGSQTRLRPRSRVYSPGERTDLTRFEDPTEGCPSSLAAMRCFSSRRRRRTPPTSVSLTARDKLLNDWIAPVVRALLGVSRD